MDRIIDSQQLRVFTTLARLLSMSDAARALNLSPSAISHGLKALEKDLGCRLMIRHSRRMVLSASGRRFLEDAHEILERMKAAREQIQSGVETRGGRQLIGFNSAIGQAVLPTVLREFRNSFPDHLLKIEALTTLEAQKRLLDDTLDFAVVVEPAPFPGLSFLPLAEDTLHFVVHPLHPWAVKRKVAREQIGRRRLILPEIGSDTFTLIAGYFKGEDTAVEPLMEVTDEEAIKHCVQLNLGAGVLPTWMVQTEIQQGSLLQLPLGRRHLKRTWGILRRREQTTGLAQSILIDLVRDALRTLMEPSVG